MIPELLALDAAGLRRTLDDGYPIDPSTIDGRRYRGVSLGLPGWVDRVLWKTFEKAFHREEDTGRLLGWNVRLQQTGLDGPIVAKEKKGQPWVFGHYEVVEKDGHLDLDYGKGANPRLDLSRWLRDPLVALQEGDNEWLFGATDVCVGSRRWRTPSYFVLQRLTDR